MNKNEENKKTINEANAVVGQQGKKSFGSKV